MCRICYVTLIYWHLWTDINISAKGKSCQAWDLKAITCFPNNSVWQEIPFHLDKFSIPSLWNIEGENRSLCNFRKTFLRSVAKPGNLGELLSPPLLGQLGYCLEVTGPGTWWRPCRRWAVQEWEGWPQLLQTQRGPGEEPLCATAPLIPIISTEITFQILFRSRETWNQNPELCMSKKLWQNWSILGKYWVFLRTRQISVYKWHNINTSKTNQARA